MKFKQNEWELYLETDSRKEALYMANFLARAIEPGFFHDPKDVPLFIVTGGFNYGKSMICEAMSRSILDQESIEEMIAEGQRFHHYLETAPSTALHTYCFQLGTIDGEPGAVSFDRITEMSLRRNKEAGYGKETHKQTSRKKKTGILGIFDLSRQNDQQDFAEQMYQTAFLEHTTIYTGLKDGYALTEGGPINLQTGKKSSLLEACQKKTSVGGAIFSSGHTKPDVTPWIHFTVEQPDYEDTFSVGAVSGSNQGTNKDPYDKNDPNHPKWHKVWNIVVHSPKLQNSPRFQKFWNALQDYAQGKTFGQDGRNIDLKTFQHEPG